MFVEKIVGDTYLIESDNVFVAMRRNGRMPLSTEKLSLPPISDMVAGTNNLYRGPNENIIANHERKGR